MVVDVDVGGMSASLAMAGWCESEMDAGAVCGMLCCVV